MSAAAPPCDPLTHRIRTMGQACYALQARKAANVLARAYNAAIAGEGLEVTQFSTLCAIALGDSHSVSALAEGLGVDRSTLVRNLARLERLGLILRRTEGRRVRHDLAPTGRALIERALPRWALVQDRIGQALAAPGLGPADGDPRQAMARLRRAVRSMPALPASALPDSYLPDSALPDSALPTSSRS